MGLKLFVAPKPHPPPRTTKSGSVSPRSGIRRPPSSSEARDRRMRRLARLHNALSRQQPAFGSEESTGFAEQLAPARRAGFRAHESSRNDAIPSSSSPSPDSDDMAMRSGSDAGTRAPLRAALREMTRAGDRRLERVDDHYRHLDRLAADMDSFDFPLPALPGERSHDNFLLNNPTIDELRRSSRRTQRRARIAGPVTARFDRSPDIPSLRNVTPPLGSLRGSFRQRDAAAPVDEQVLGVVSRFRDDRRGQPRSARTGPSRHLPSHRGAGLDGLGDRDRSLSPEWGMLLATLTPDPQPPSASSSFVSAAASQGAGASFLTTTSAPEAAESTAVEPPCESGFENSDGEEQQGHGHIDLARFRRRREGPGHPNTRLPDYNLDGPADGPLPSPRRASNVPRQASRADALSSLRNRPLWDDEQYPPLRYNDLFSGQTGARDAWVGQLSVGASDDEQRDDRPRFYREASSGQAQNLSITEEDWPGMRRIVRSMAMREDIPDGWWLEAGLSRTLPRDDTN